MTIFEVYLKRLAPHWREYQEARGTEVWEGPAYDKLRQHCYKIRVEMRAEGIIKRA